MKLTGPVNDESDWMIRRPARRLRGAGVGGRGRAVSATLLAVSLVWAFPCRALAGPPWVDPELREAVAAGTVRVLVELRVAAGPSVPASAGAIAAAGQRLLARLAGARVTVVRQYSTVPLLALEVDAEALARLGAMDDLVERVVRDTTAAPATPSSGRQHGPGTGSEKP